MNKLAYLIERSAVYYKDRTALIADSSTLSFKQVNEKANAISNSLISLDVNKGARAGVLLGNTPEHVTTDFALIKCGLVRVPLNTRLVPREIEYILNDSQAEVLIYDYLYKEKIEAIRHQLKTVRHFICTGGIHQQDLSLEKLMEEASTSNQARPVSDEDLFQILYTSGTTGRPKGAVTTVKSRISAITNVLMDELTLDPTDAMLHVASLAHGGGTKVLPFYIKGAANILMTKFSPRHFFETVEKYKVTTTWLVPTMVSMLLEYEEKHDYDFSSLESIIYAGAPMPVATLKKAIEQFGNIFIQVYGLSEAPNPDLILTKSDHLIGLYENPELLASAGREITHVRVRIVDDHGNDVADGEIGEVVISGDNIMKEYWNVRDATEETIKDGWLYTGDLARRDSQGYIYIVDRRKDLIISGGFNVYPREIEEVLYQHEGILEAAVFGVPDKKWGEAVKACIVIREGYSLSEEDVINYCRENLANYKKPSSVEFLKELPKNTNGKILKKELRDVYWKNVNTEANEKGGL